jgi:hypothetical protein
LDPRLCVYDDSVDWLYKATNTKLDHVGTMLLAGRRGFLCRSAYDAARTWADNVGKVAFGDTIHFYYVDRNRKVLDIGAFMVIHREEHPTPDAFGNVVPETALYVVENPDFIKKLDEKGAYQPDPVIGKLTGWLLRGVGKPVRYGIPSPHAKFNNPKFWGPAKQGNVVLPDGYKMKWHQLGPGHVQLRLPVMPFTRSAFLCEAYVKNSPATDQRKMARFKTHMNLISQGRYVYRGAL